MNVHVPPKKAKLKGVKNIAAKVEMAVRLTANATFPLAMELIKFENIPTRTCGPHNHTECNRWGWIE